MLERPVEVRLRAIGEGIHLLLVLGFPHPHHLELPPPSNSPNPIPLAREFSPPPLRLPIKLCRLETVEKL